MGETDELNLRLLLSSHFVSEAGGVYLRGGASPSKVQPTGLERGHINRVHSTRAALAKTSHEAQSVYILWQRRRFRYSDRRPVSVGGKGGV